MPARAYHGFVIRSGRLAVCQSISSDFPFIPKGPGMFLLAQAAEQTASTTGYIDRYLIPAIWVIILVLAAFFLSGWVGALVRRGCEKARIDLTLARFFGKLARWTILVLAILSILSYFGVQTTSFAAVIGASALAIGLAFQGTLANFAAGMMLLIFRPFKVGDAVEVAGETGKIYEIDLFNTIMDTFDNRRLILPNGSVFGSTIENITFHPTRRVDVNVGVAYSADIDRTRGALMAAVDSLDQVHQEPEPVAYLLELGYSSVNWVVRVWTDTPDFWAVREKLTHAIKRELDAAGLQIPFPQMDVHLDGGVTQKSEG
jgi:small conductance mechanosensitive channel